MGMHSVTTALLLIASAAQPAPAPSEGVAAVAFRDAVPDYQRIGSRLFTAHYLEQAYDHVDYFENTNGAVSDVWERMEAALADALRRYAAVDLFLLVNAGTEYRTVARLPAELRSRLRLVYNTGAGGGAQAATWTQLGVGSYVSHPGSANLAPFFYVDFLRNWTEGMALDEAVARANGSFHDRLHDASTRWILRLQGLRYDDTALDAWDTATRATIAGATSVRLHGSP
jgi:hypothetical protein